jgi:subtilisin-like proprotein convertase family protein
VGRLWEALVALIALAPACFDPLERPVCGPGGECPDPLRCSADTNRCEPPGAPPGGMSGGIAAEWKLDTAADFAAAGHAVTSMTIDPRGSLTPDAYTYGGLVAHGLQGVRLWSSTNTNWSNVEVVTPSGAGLWRGESFDGLSVLAYLGITTPGDISIWFEGEVFLQQGSNQMFLVRGDDVAFVEVADPGTASYRPVPASTSPVAVATPETGWYPIRIGFADSGGGREFLFHHSDNGTAPIPWARNRLRGRTSALRGALRTICNRQILGGGIGAEHPVSRVEPGVLLANTVFNTAPQGTDIDNEDWSARYLGQLYVDQPGAYTLAISSDDGNRGRLGAARGDDAWARDQGDGGAATSIPATLDAGWNDLFVDYNQVNGGRRLQIRLTGGGLNGAEVPRDRLRPVESADDRLMFVTNDTDLLVADGPGHGPVLVDLPVAGFPGEIVTAIELTYQITSDNWTDLEVKLERPGPNAVTIRPQGAGLPNGSRIVQLPIAMGGMFAALLGGPADGLWRLHVDDVVPDSGDSSFQNARLTLHTTGGPPKVALTSSWTSQALDATDVLGIDGISWDERAPASASVKVFARTCQQAGCSDDPAWSEAVKAMPVIAARGRYLQLRVDMTSDGIREPELHALAVMYRREE